jgi:hypothetical protein
MNLRNVFLGVAAVSLIAVPVAAQQSNPAAALSIAASPKAPGRIERSGTVVKKDSKILGLPLVVVLLGAAAATAAIVAVATSGGNSSSP